MGNTPSKARPVDVPRRPQNKLSKPRTNSSKINIIDASAAPSRRNSSSVAPSTVSDNNRHSCGVPSNIARVSGTRSRSGSTRQRLRQSLFRSKSDNRSRASSLVVTTTTTTTTTDEAARDWLHVGLPVRGDGQLLNSSAIESSAHQQQQQQQQQQPLSRPNSRRGSSAFAYSLNPSRLSLVAEALTPEPNIDEASRRLERVLVRPRRERSKSEVDVVPIRRRSMLMTPGVATRRDSNGDLLYEPFPVSRRLSAAAAVRCKRNSYFDTFTPDLGVYAALPALPPRPAASFQEAPRTATPCEQDFAHLGAYKIGTLRITNADSHEIDADSPVNLSPEVPPVKPQPDSTNADPAAKCQDAEALNSLSPFSFQNSRSPSPRLHTTSKTTAVEDELFEEELASGVIVPGSPADALRILDGGARADYFLPLVKPGPTSPVRVANTQTSSQNAAEASKQMPDKPLTKNDSGYSSMRSFKLKGESRAVAANPHDKALPPLPAGSSAGAPPSTADGALPSLKIQTAAVPTSNEPSQQSASSPSPPVESSKPWSFRPGLTIGRRTSNTSPGEMDAVKSASPTPLIRRFIQRRPAPQPTVTLTSDRNVDSELIPPVSPVASARLGEREKEWPALTHNTYKSTWKTDSSETLTTIMSMTETGDASKSPLGHGTPVMTVKEEDLVSRHTASKADGGWKAKKSPWRNTTQGDFESHITSFGTVSESLGASPYDLAVSAAMAPRKRSQSFHSMPADRLTSANRSNSSNDLAPQHNIRRPAVGVRTGMDAETASKMARNKSRDREISRQLHLEKTRDDRAALPSSKMARPSIIHTTARSPRARKWNSSAQVPQTPSTLAAGPVAQPALPAVAYPQYGPWVPQRPHGVPSQSTNNVVHHPDNHHHQHSVRSASTRASMENMRQPLPNIIRKQPSYDQYHESAYRYEAGYDARDGWARRGAGVGVHSLQFGAGFGDAPVMMQRVRQEA